MSKTMIDHYRDGLMQETLGYDDWKNQNKGKLKMTNGVESALDAAENQAMYKLYQQEIQASNAKNEALAGIEKNRAQALRENAVLTERAKEYAAKNAALRGVSNSGISQTSMIDLMSQMAGVRADTQAQYDNQKQSVLQEYMNAINQAKSAASDTVGNVAIQKAANRENDENTLTELSKSYTDLSQLKTSAEEFKSKYGYVPANIEAMLNNNQASQVQLDSWIAAAKEGSYGGKSVDAHDLSGNLFTQNLEDAGKFGGDSTFDLPNVENKYENKILRMIKGGAITDGTVIRDTKGKNGNFVYIRGKFYQIDNDQVESFGRIFDIDEGGDSLAGRDRFLDLDEKTGNKIVGSESAYKQLIDNHGYHDVATINNADGLSSDARREIQADIDSGKIQNGDIIVDSQNGADGWYIYAYGKFYHVYGVNKHRLPEEYFASTHEYGAK